MSFHHTINNNSNHSMSKLLHLPLPSGPFVVIILKQIYIKQTYPVSSKMALPILFSVSKTCYYIPVTLSQNLRDALTIRK